MKKHLIAAAVAAAVAVPAAAQVTVYGTMDIGYTANKNDQTGNISNKVTTYGNGDGGLSTSVLGFRGEEDLGGGLKASFNLQYDLNDVGTGGNATGTRTSVVGVSGAFGSVKFGRDTSAIHGIVAGFSAGAGNNTVGALYSAGNAKVPNHDQIRPHGVFTSDMISYSTPSVNGFVGRVDLGKTTTDANGATATENKETGYSVRYTKGALDVGFAHQKREQTGAWTNATIDTFFNVNNTGPFGGGAGGAFNLTLISKVNALGASYNFGMAQPFVLHTNRKDSFGAINGAVNEFLNTTVTEIGVRVPVGSTNLFVSSYSGDSEAVPAPGEAALEGYQFGATYAMSKRTTLYAIHGQQKSEQDANFAGGAAFNSKTKGTAIGVRHTF